jgi:hypothetical protein
MILAMHRREFLMTAGGVMLTTGVFTTGHSPADADGDIDKWCIAESDAAETGDGAPLTPTDDPDFVVDDSAAKSVNVYWRPGSVFADLGFPFARGYATIGGETIYLNSGAQSEINHYTVLHELAHSLGYRHGDGGVVDPDVALFADTGDRSPGGGLAASTRDVAQTFTGLRHIDSSEWDVETLGDLGSDFAAGGTGISQLGIAGQAFAMADGQQREEVYFTDSYGGFGGRFETGYRDDAANVLTGRYYTEN